MHASFYSALLIAGTVMLGASACSEAQDHEPLTKARLETSQAETLPAITAPTQDCIVGGHWQNDRGSGVSFTCGPEGRLSGTYNTNVGAPDKGQSFPLTGWYDGDNVSFTVNFKGYGSITAWAGQIEDIGGAPQLKTLWHLTRAVPDENEAADMWKSVTAGASVFTRAGEN